MLSVLLQSLALASVGILSPGSITIVILLLMSDKGWRNGVAYMLGYISMYLLIGTSVLVVGVESAQGGSTDQSLTTSIVLLCLSLLLLALTVRNWRKPPAKGKEPSRFAKIIDGITPIKSFAFAAAIAVINFKNLAIFLSAVSVLLLSDLLLTTKLTILVPLVLIFCLSVIIPVAIYLLFPARANEFLSRIKLTIERYSRPIGIALTLIIGILFLYRGVSGIL